MNQNQLMHKEKGHSNRKKTAKSQLLEDFRSRSRKIEFEELQGHITEFAQDQHGSRYIQQLYEGAGENERTIIFEEIRQNTLGLCVDVFGN